MESRPMYAKYISLQRISIRRYQNQAAARIQMLMTKLNYFYRIEKMLNNIVHHNAIKSFLKGKLLLCIRECQLHTFFFQISAVAAVKVASIQILISLLRKSQQQLPIAESQI